MHKVHDLVLSVDVHQLEAIVAIAATGVAQDAAIQRPDLGLEEFEGLDGHVGNLDER